MYELSKEELELVHGGVDYYDAWTQVRQIVRELPDAYREAIQSVTDMMCTATGRC